MAARLDVRGVAEAGSTTLLWSAALVVAVVSLSPPAPNAPLAVYALAYWHYYLYFLAYRYGSVPLRVFQRDAVAMKAVSLAGLGFAVVAAGPELLPLAVLAAGFALNAYAAGVLGSDRTYYGDEVAGMPRLRVSTFPFSRIPHPMLVGNLIAYSGLLLDAGFRDAWWPLAAGHLVLNVGLLLMEMRLAPLRRAVRGVKVSPLPAVPWAPVVAALGALLGAGAALAGSVSAASPIAAAVGGALAVYAFVMFRWYSGARPAAGGSADTRGPE